MENVENEVRRRGKGIKSKVVKMSGERGKGKRSLN